MQHKVELPPWVWQLCTTGLKKKKRKDEGLGVKLPRLRSLGCSGSLGWDTHSEGSKGTKKETAHVLTERTPTWIQTQLQHFTWSMCHFMLPLPKEFWHVTNWLFLNSELILKSNLKVLYVTFYMYELLCLFVSSEWNNCNISSYFSCLKLPINCFLCKGQFYEHNPKDAVCNFS